MTTVYHEIMSLWLAPERATDGVFQVDIVAVAQGRPQIGGVFLAEAEIKATGASYPDAVATFTEIMGKRGDKSQTPARFSDDAIASGAARLIVRVIQRPALFEPRLNHRQGEILV
jgi:hypothetical protein